MRLWFDPSQIAAMARIQRLHRELNLNYASLGLVIDLLDRIARARAVATAPRCHEEEIDGPEPLTQKSQEALHDAQTKALRFGHTEVDGEHLLLALLDQTEGLVAPLLARAGADPDRLREDVEAELRPPAPRFRSGCGARAGVRHPAALPPARDAPTGRPSGSRTSTSRSSTWSSPCSMRARSSAAGRLLQQHGLTRDGFLAALTEVRGHQRVTSATPEGTYEALEKYGRDLVAEAAAGRLDPVIGRDAEIRRIIQILSRKTKNNPVLIGEPGRRQDRDRRGAGPADRQRRRARGPARQDRLRSGHGRRWSPARSTAASSRSG